MKKFYSNLSLALVGLSLLSTTSLSKPNKNIPSTFLNNKPKLEIKYKLDLLDSKKGYDIKSIRQKVFEEFKKIRKNASLDTNICLDENFCYFTQLFADTLVYASKNEFSHYYAAEQFLERFSYLHQDKKILQEACAETIFFEKESNFNFQFLENRFINLLVSLLYSNSHKQIILGKDIDVCGIGLGLRTNSLNNIVYGRIVLVIILGKDDNP